MSIKEIRRERLRQLLAGFDTHKEFAELVKRQSSQISQWLSGYRTIEEDTARDLERKAGKPIHWMDVPGLNESPGLYKGSPTEPGGSPSGAAHDLSHLSQIVAPTVSWERLKMQASDLPVEFHVVLPDDAMAPRAPAGVKVKFNRSLLPQPGDGVLVQQAQGAVYFREYRARVGTAWTAHATNPAYPSLQSDEHNLVVLAVFAGIDTTWASLAR